MPAPPPDARSFLAEVLSVEPCGDDGVLLRVRPPEPLAPVRASRFFMLRREDGASPLIPRPFSIYRQPGGALEFLVKVMGRGTRALAACAPGAALRVIGPLGNGWPTLDPDGPPWVMLAGGVGSAPFPLAIEQALAGMDGRPPVPRERIAYLHGAATRGLLYDVAAIRSLGAPVFTATLDGSEGRRGHVLDLLSSLWEERRLPREVRLLACGPERMLQAVGSLALERGLDCWLSLETLMGCGVGICNGCPIPTRPDGPRGGWPNVKCCVEGPVFHAREIELGAVISPPAPSPPPRSPRAPS